VTHALLLLLAAVPPSWADEVAPAPEDVAPVEVLADPARGGAERWTLDDGTHVVLVEDHRKPLVELRVQVPAGSYTPWFRDHGGKEAFLNQFYDPDAALRTRADALAADVSFSIKEQRSFLSVSCLKRDLPEVVALVRDILANTTYDPHELDRDQKTRQIDWKSSQKNPQQRSMQAAAAALYQPGDARLLPFTEPVDVVKDIDQLVATRDALLRMPGRALGFAGDLTRAEVDALAGDLLPPMVAEAPGERDIVVHDLRERAPTETVRMDGLNQVTFVWFRDGLVWDDPDYAAWRVASHVLGGHFYSRLNVALRHEGGETYGARVLWDGATEARIYALSTYTRTANADPTEAKLRAVMDTLRAEGITRQELDDAVGYMRGKRLFALQSPEGPLNDAMWELGTGNDPGFVDAEVEAAEALTLDEVNAFIRAYYDPAAFTMLRVEPKGDKPAPE
jgi:zinc protease